MGIDFFSGFWKLNKPTGLLIPFGICQLSYITSSFVCCNVLLAYITCLNSQRHVAFKHVWF